MINLPYMTMLNGRTIWNHQTLILLSQKRYESKPCPHYRALAVSSEDYVNARNDGTNVKLYDVVWNISDEYDSIIHPIEMACDWNRADHADVIGYVYPDEIKISMEDLKC